MRPRHHLAVAAVLIVAVLVAFAGNGVDIEPGPVSPDVPPAVLGAVDRPSTDETAPPAASTTTVPVAERLPLLRVDVPGAVRLSDGTARAVLGTDGAVWIVDGACGGDDTAEPTVAQIGPRHVVLDPAGGGADRGVEADGLVEAELNLDVARRVESILAEAGVAVSLTRETDTDLGTAARGHLGPAVGALALVSIHHAPPGDETTDEARPAVIHQIDDPASRRLAGLVHAELRQAFATRPGPWSALDEPGVMPLLNQRGEDYHVVLRAGTGVPAVRVTVGALGPSETTLLGSEEGRGLEAEALARAVVRFLVTDDEGDGFVEPREPVRQAPTSNAPGACG